MKVLPPIPNVVHGILGPIPVRVVADLRDDEGVSIYGFWDNASRTIAIRAEMTIELQWATLEHERTHAALFDIGLSLELDDALEERICNAIAAHRMADWLQGKPQRARSRRAPAQGPT